MNKLAETSLNNSKLLTITLQQQEIIKNKVINVLEDLTKQHWLLSFFGTDHKTFGQAVVNKNQGQKEWAIVK